MRHLLRENPAWGLALGAILLSFAPVMVRASASPPTTAAFYRMLFGGLILLGYQLIRRDRFSIKPRTAMILTAAGFAFAFDLFFWHRSIHMIGPGLATLLSGFQVFILAVISVLFLHERMRWQLAVAIPGAFAGVAMIIGVDWATLSESYQTGITFGLATAVCYSAFLLIMRWQRLNDISGATPLVEVAWMSLACAVILAITAGISGESLAISNVNEAWLLAVYALLAVIGIVVISWSLDKVATSLVGLLLLLEPTFAYVWDLTFFSRDVTTLELAGAALALGAIYLGSMKLPPNN
jgi:drug/metabolite transporter (DMT)-like permease